MHRYELDHWEYQHGSPRRREIMEALADHLRERQLREEREKFNLRNGGLMLRREYGGKRVEVGLWSSRGGFEFLRISW